MPAQAIVTLNAETQALQIELPGVNGYRRRVELRPGDSIENVLRVCLEGMAKKQYSVGEDGAPTSAQVRHWQRHGTARPHAEGRIEYFTADGQIGWGDPQCPFCQAEGRFSRATKRDRRITKIDAGALALRARGYIERSAGKWFHKSRETVFLSPTGVLASPQTGKWPRAKVEELREEGQAEANRLGYTSPQFRKDILASHSDGTVVRKAAASTKKQKEAAIAAKVQRVAQGTINF